MRKLDKLIIKSFIGPFVLTTAVATFILLIQYMLKYFDDFVGKDLGFMVFAKLLFYFALNMLQVALPLGVLVSSLMTFGNLGENFELTAIKSAGISLVRALRPVFFFAVLISIGAFFFNNYAVPVANLNAYSLLYDIKHKKPTLDIQEGAFYYGLPNYVIKVKEKLPDDISLKDVIIYDHTGSAGNKRVILADSSRMYTFLDDRYLKLELYDGNYYSEEKKLRNPIDRFSRTKYSRMDMVFSLASFALDTTDQSLFQNNRQMKNVSQLTHDIDSMKVRILETQSSFEERAMRYFSYFKEDYREDQRLQERNKQQDSVNTNVEFPSYLEHEADLGAKRLKPRKRPKSSKKSIVKKSLKNGRVERADTIKLSSLSLVDLDSIMIAKNVSMEGLVKSARTQSRNIQNTLNSLVSRTQATDRERNKYVISKFKIFSQAAACIVMFLIGAPLGAIIKKGGMGVPVIISIFFFIAYYIMTIMGQKYAKEGIMDGAFSVWIADLVLLPFGIFFLRQARIDARLFDVDIYIIWWDKLMARFRQRKKLVNT
ncbi:MAG: YjgP/YjgQ family permease [Cytophagales bacterium]|nr:YjgP/YjgQ family permease [Cytophagales bacterium]